MNNFVWRPSSRHVLNRIRIEMTIPLDLEHMKIVENIYVIMTVCSNNIFLGFFQDYEKRLSMENDDTEEEYSQRKAVAKFLAKVCFSYVNFLVLFSYGIAS